MNHILLIAGAVATPGPIAGSAQSTAPIADRDYTLTVHVIGLTGNSLRFGLEDSADGTNWMPFQVWEVAGPISQSSHGARKYNAPGLQTSANAQARVAVYSLDGTATLTADISYPE